MTGSANASEAPASAGARDCQGYPFSTQAPPDIVPPMPEPQITDEESLERWLKGRPRQDAVVIAYRAAMRVVPFWWSRPLPILLPNGKVGNLSLLRVLLLAGSMHLFQPMTRQEIGKPAVAALTFRKGGNHAGLSARAAALSSFGHSEYVAARARRSLHEAIAAVASIASGKSALLHETARDCDQFELGVDRLSLPLWSTAPKWFERQWEKTIGIWSNLSPGAAFWITWYEKALRGEHDWPLLRDVALIPDEDWQKGDAHVARIIEGLVAKNALDDAIAQNPYAHRVLFDGSLGKLVSVAVEVPDLASIIEALRRVIRDFEKRCKDDTSHNKLGEDLKRISGPALKDLKRDAKRFAARPLDLFDAIGAAQREIGRTAQSEGLGKDAFIGRLIDELGTGAEDICVASPAVLDTQRKRMDVRYALLTEERRVAVLSICAGMRADSTGFLEAAAGVALQIAGDPGRSEEEKRQAWYFMQAMLPRGARAMIAAKEDAVEGAAGKKKGKLDTVVAVADAAVKLDKGVDAIQEMAGEALGAVEGLQDWVPRLISEVQSGNWFGWRS